MIMFLKKNIRIFDFFFILYKQSHKLFKYYTKKKLKESESENWTMRIELVIQVHKDLIWQWESSCFCVE